MHNLLDNNYLIKNTHTAIIVILKEAPIKLNHQIYHESFSETVTKRNGEYRSHCPIVNGYQYI